MKHVNETEWNDYLAGVCKADRLAWIDAHVKGCPACRRQMQALRDVEAMLSDWQVNTAGHDIAAKVKQIAQQTPRSERSTIRLSHRRLWSYAARIAAAVLIGISLGHWAGKNSARSHIAKQQGTSVEATPGYLAALDLQFASDLTWSVLETEQTNAEDQQ